MEKRFILILGFWALFLSGCVTDDFERPIPPEEAIAYVPGTFSGPNEGYLVGSYAYAGVHPSDLARALTKHEFRYEIYSLYFRKSGAGKEALRGDVGFKSKFGSDEGLDFEIEEGAGYVFAIPLPAGSYHFYNYWIWMNGGSPASDYWKAKRDFAIPFEIRAGEATYIGEVVANHHFERSLLGIYIPHGAELVGSDRSDRDEALLAEKYPFLATMPVSKTLIADGLQEHFDEIRRRKAEQRAKWAEKKPHWAE